MREIEVENANGIVLGFIQYDTEGVTSYNELAYTKGYKIAEEEMSAEGWNFLYKWIPNRPERAFDVQRFDVWSLTDIPKKLAESALLHEFEYKEIECANFERECAYQLLRGKFRFDDQTLTFSPKIQNETA